MTARRMPRWPLAVIGAPAAVAIWSGWVGLGGLCGFGPVDLLPGINGSATVNTAICLPVGMEAYAAFALAVWLRESAVPPGARKFAKQSAIAALALGMLGQVAYHVLSALHVTRAPIPVVVLVSCIPVGVLGLAAALAHLMSMPAGQPSRGKVSAPVFTDAQSAALEVLRRTTEAGNPLSANKLAAQFRLTRAEVTEVREAVERDRGAVIPPLPHGAPVTSQPPAGGAALPSMNGGGRA